MKHFLPICMFMLVCMWSVFIEPATTAGVAQAEVQWDRDLAPGWYRGLGAEQTVETLEKAAQELKAVPLYSRLSVGVFLIQALNEDRRVKIPEYERPAGSHDIRRTAGRAAFYLEEAFSLTLPTITELTAAAELEQIQQSATLQLSAYRQGIVDAVIAYRLGTDSHAVRRTYQSAIQKGSPTDTTHVFTGEASRSFAKMLDEWFPLDKRLVDLSSIVGRVPARFIDREEVQNLDEDLASATGIYLYRFGFGGLFSPAIYYFIVKNGVITDVIYQPSV